ncbi:Beta-ketoacyl synthase [Streptomyces violaceusniger Tu 4113]|uniref:Beta-ketoacyl synthase n=1 Tax=Streptomyces violaceusniger (strain Tu 4113) TaxID=653045 RepID=G2NUD8_STRV4|nr:type I polyketide synthase [Streptomyces violaceusniger]AEM84316.1 Beta-ketoacyl synthase [Streptomyces violaceusniger Tu 4113]
MTDDAMLREYLVKATNQLRATRDQLQKVEAAGSEPIAVVGIGCRFPGGVGTADELWDLVAQGQDVVSELPEDRGWNVEALSDPGDDVRGSNTRHGGFLTGADRFDAEFFGISAHEALAMDPQQRLLLETTWEACEHARIDPGSLRGSRTGVYIGAGAQDYGPRLDSGGDGHALTGTSVSVASGRIAYTLGLEGPAVTLDTACSSSLVALHLAVRSLRVKECDFAFAGGVTVMCGPGVFVQFSRLGGLSPDGRCKSFAAGADGTGWAEGAGVLALERLSDARRRGHRVLAVVRGTAVNSDGASNGLSAPNGLAQQRVIREALANAGLELSDVDAVEAHGTGTVLGDPVEARALLDTYGRGRPAERPLWIGSLKSNIGHTQAAAGVAGIIKMVMAMRNGVLPRTLHVDRPTPHVNWDSGAVRIATDAQPWPRSAHPRRAAVSAFGISGTNAHVVLEAAPSVAEPDRAADGGRTLPWVLSAKTREALAEQAERLLAHVRQSPGVRAEDIAYSLATTRAGLRHRAVLLAGDRHEAQAGLEALAREDPDGNPVHSSTRSGGIAFLFGGDSVRRQGTGRELYDTFPTYAEAFDAVCDCLDRRLAGYAEHRIRDVLFGVDGVPAELLDEAVYALPATFAVEIALFRLFEAWGVRPKLVAGYSHGEMAAAHAAGIFSLEDAATLVAARGRLVQSLPADGACLAVQAGEEELLAAAAEHGAEVEVVAVDGPASVLAYGTVEALTEIADHFAGLGRGLSRPAVGRVAHSTRMDGILDAFRAIVSELPRCEPSIPVVSTRTGRILELDTLRTSEHWVRQLRELVRFQDTMRTVDDHDLATVLTLGPDATLAACARHARVGGEHEDKPLPVAVLRSDEPETTTVLTALGHAHVHGGPVEWDAVFAGTDSRRTDLPTYAFQRRRYWLDAPSGGGSIATDLGQGTTGHPLLAAAITVADGEQTIFTGRLSRQSHRWLTDHQVLGSVVVPGTALVELALHAGTGSGALVLDELVIEAPLVLPDRGGVQVQVTLGPADSVGGRPVTIHSRGEHPPDAGWNRNARGILTTVDRQSVPAGLSWPPADAARLDIDAVYAALGESGLHYGPAFRALRGAWRRGDDYFVEVALAPGQQAYAPQFGMHPALLDAALHVAGHHGVCAADEPVTLLPFAWRGVRTWAAGATAMRAAVRIGESGEVSVQASDAEGNPVLSVAALRLRPVSPDRPLLTQAVADDRLLRVEWASLPLSGDHAAPEFAEFAQLVDTDLPVPELTVLTVGMSGTPAQLTAETRETVSDVLKSLQSWLADQRFAHSTLLVITRNAVAVTKDESPDLVGAAVWGLVRTAQRENPGRIVLVDSTRHPEDLPAVVATAAAARRPQLALRHGQEVRIPRLARIDAPNGAETSRRWNPDGTVLITGGTGTLGSLVAQHLVTAHGVRHLVLASRSGLAGPGGDRLLAELTKLGARVTVETGDLSDRDHLADLIGRIPTRHPLIGVVHAAGVTEDGVLGSLDERAVASVLGPKADTAWYLHELTRDLGLSMFVLFSSVAGVLGGRGQANYAAANSFLDALAEHRAQRGLAARSIAWGLWEPTSTLSGGLTSADLRRIARDGLLPITAETGLGLLDTALAVDHPAVVATPLDLDTLRAAGDAAPALLAELVAASGSRDARPELPDSTLRSTLLRLTPHERRRHLLGIVLGALATALPQHDASSIDPDSTFEELGFDSLAAIDFRNRLTSLIGQRQSPTLVFDHPTPEKLTGHLLGRFVLDEGNPTIPAAVPAAAPARVHDDPIAIVGMACRYPGGISSPDELWHQVSHGLDATSAFPVDRGWDLAELYDPDPDAIGKCYARRGGFLHDAADFDATLFGMSPKEALTTDPQQRLLLETSWEALERAGISPESLRGSDTGVFVGVMYNDYAARFVNDAHDLEAQVSLGSTASVASGRISYTLGLHGPSSTVDTACSSSLVAMHSAARALRSGECSLALVGGATVMSTPNAFVMFSRMRGLSPDGRCKSYAAAADGTGWAEGAGTLLLERLSDARRHGHQVLALFRGSAVNSDGASNSLTAPNGPAQQRVIVNALADAGLSTKDVDVVEGHGTGTSLGDPIEAQALLATYGSDRDTPLLLGSVKSNIGHTQAAAGIAGVIKMVQAMRHGTVPPSLHVDEPSPHVDWTGGAVRLVTEEQPWPDTAVRPRRAGISAFGISGTNAHVILEAPAVEDREPIAARLPAPPPWLLSGMTPAALRAQAAALLAAAPAHVNDVAFTLATARSALAHRAAVPAGDLAALDALAKDVHHPAVVSGSARHSQLALLFSGQGSQRQGMGRELGAAFPVFAEAFAEAARHLDTHLERPLVEVVAQEGALLDRTDFAQAGIFAFEVAAFRLLQSWGVRPDHLIGHSIGEVVAAHVAGMLTLPDAAALVCARGRLMNGLPAGGGMLAVEAGEEEVTRVLADQDGIVVVAAVNGPRSVVVSGAEAAVSAVRAVFDRMGRRTRALQVSHAFHSPLLDPMLAEFREVVRGIRFDAPRLPIVSTVTGRRADAEELRDPEYWVRQARRTVRFADAVRTLDRADVSTFLEVGPSSALAAMAGDSVTAEDALVTAAIRRKGNEADEIMRAVARLHVRGVKVDWTAVFAHSGEQVVDLPTYRFQRRRFWLDRRPAAVDTGGLGHPVLSHAGPVPGTGQLLCWGRLSAKIHPWLADHVIDGRAILPATAFVELAGRAGAEVDCPAVEELVVHTPLVIPDSAEVLVQVLVGEPDESGTRGVEVHACRAGRGTREDWAAHATGTVRPGAPAPADPDESGHWPPRGAVELTLDGAYPALAEMGMEYGPGFRNVTQVWQRGTEIFAAVRLPDERIREDKGFRLHPAVLDAALHSLIVASPRHAAEDGAVRLPFAWNDVQVFVPDAHHVRVRLHQIDATTLSLTLTDQWGTPVARVGSVTTKTASSADSPSSAGLYGLTWTDIPVGDGGPLSEADSVVRVAGMDRHADPVAAVHAETVTALRAVQHWSTERSHLGGRLILVTRNATTQTPDLAAAAVWGLGRTVQAEYPGRVVLVDLDGTPESEDVMSAAIASGEAQLAVRAARVSVPRLTSVEPGPAGSLDTTGTVLITGGTGSLGSLIARHLVTAHDARSVVLVSRSGGDARRNDEILAAFAEHDAHLRIVACDVTDGEALAKLADSLDPPLTAVIHAAGVLDDGVVEALTPQRMADVLRPKVDAAWRLQELVDRLNVPSFVLFSSIAGLLGSAGQGNYAAGNSFLDALARRRSAHGKPTSSLAWGPWGHGEGMATGIRGGLVPPLTVEQGLALFDAAVDSELPVLAPIRLDRAELRGGRTPVPPLLRTPLSHTATRERPVTAGEGSQGSPAAPEAFRARLNALSGPARKAALVDLVRGEMAAVLGHRDAADMNPGHTFAELGFDSLASVTLRNRLSALTGVRLPATIAFEVRSDHELADHLDEGLAGSEPAAPPAATSGIRLASFYRRLCEAGEPVSAMHMLLSASLALPAFGPADSREHAPLPVRMAAGPHGPALVCFPSFFPPAGLGTYGKFAPRFDGERDMFEIQYPGLVAGEVVPRDWDTLVTMHAETVRAQFGDRRIVLLGHSIGGCTAQAVAAKLIELGSPPAGLVLGDTYPVTEANVSQEWLLDLPASRVTRAGVQFEELTGDTPLAAMGAYNRMLVQSAWRPSPLPVPTLLVRALDPMPLMRTDGATDSWRSTWPQPHDAVDIPGNHEELPYEQVEAFTTGIREWLRETFDPRQTR